MHKKQQPDAVAPFVLFYQLLTDNQIKLTNIIE